MTKGNVGNRFSTKVRARAVRMVLESEAAMRLSIVVPFMAGVFDLADRIRALRRDKPVWAFVAEHAFSAGYALASQANRILLPRTGAVGSIGVLVMHANLSGQLYREGVRVTLIHWVSSFLSQWTSSGVKMPWVECGRSAL